MLMAQIWVLRDKATGERVAYTHKGREAAIEMANRLRTRSPASYFVMFTGQDTRPLTRLWDFPPLTA